MKRMAFVLVCVLLAAYIVGFIALAIFETQLIFSPQKIDEGFAEYVRSYSNVEEISIQTGDNVSLHGWLVNSQENEASPLLIYYGGNAEEVSHMISHTHKFPGFSLLLMNYRGYGLSQGAPSEKNLKQDAELIFDAITEREDIDCTRVVVMGRSIGTGVAVHMAAERDVKGAILVTPYDSLVNVAQNSFRIYPVSWFMRNRFQSDAIALDIDVPMLALVAETDEIIPKASSLNLVDQWGGEVQMVMIEGAGHNDIFYSDVFWKSINDFLKRLAPGSEGS